jgi:GNAT superfamily N-acetyltransferase
MDIEVRPVDPGDEVALAARHAVQVAAFAHDVPDFPAPCPVLLAERLRNPGKSWALQAWVAYLAGEPVGVLEVELPLREDLDTARVELFVAPRYRRQGIGRTLYAVATEYARRHGRVRLTASVVAGEGPGFARAMGATEALAEVRRRLDLSTVDVDALSAREAPGYSVVYWRDLAPEEYRADLARLERRLVNDAPRGELVLDDPVIDADRVRDDQEVRLGWRVRAYHGAVRHDATGTLVAWSTIGVEATVADHAWQWITVVDRDHRGHGLGLRLKLANLRRVMREEPALRTIDTWNAASNRHMIAINEAMGFRVVDQWGQWQHEFR